MDTEVPAELIADIEEAGLGYWPTDLAQIAQAPYQPNVLLAYAYRDGGVHVQPDGDR